MSADCIFCKIIAGKIPGKIVYRDDNYIVFFDVNPKAALHLLICPVEHTETFQQADPELIAGATEVIQNLARELSIENNYAIQINNGADSGQIVFHLHLHMMSHDTEAVEKATSLAHRA